RPRWKHTLARCSHILPLPCTWTDFAILPETRERILNKMSSKPTRPTSPRFRSSLTSTKTLLDSLVRLSPLSLLANPVMFIVELTFFIVAAMAIYPPAFYPVANSSMRIYTGQEGAWGRGHRGIESDQRYSHCPGHGEP